MAPFSWSRRNTRSVYDDVSDDVVRYGQFFDIPTLSTEKADSRPQPPSEPSQQTFSLVQHSRSSTMTSTLSFYEHSTSEASLTHASRPLSEETPQDQPSELPETKRNLFSKGSHYLKRHGSKLSLTSSISTQSFEPHNLEDSVPSLPSPERISKHARKDSAAVVRRDVMKRTISEPFDFHHVTHTDRGHFGDFERTHDRELIGEFSAIRAGQQSKKEIRGFRVDSLAEMQKSVDLRDTSGETSPITTPMPSLPTSPVRPAPPPKDSPTSTPLPKPIDIRLSRSVENFSRPSPRSPVSPNRPNVPGPALAVADLREQSSTESLPIDFNKGYAVDTLPGQAIPFPPPLDKPLPEIPVSLQCHAVTTDDDTARPLRSVPLPSLPFKPVEVPEDENTILGSTNPPDTRRRSLRHMHTFPSAQPADRRSKRGSTTMAKFFPDAVTHDALQKVVASAEKSGRATPSRKRVAAGFGAIEIQNWEDAVDYSWDHDTEAEVDLLDWHQDSDESTETAATIVNHLAGRDHQESPQSPTIAPVISLAPLTIDTSDATLTSARQSKIINRQSRPYKPHSSQNSLNILHGLGIQQSGASFTPSHSHSSSDTREGTPKPYDRPSLSHQSSSHSDFSKSSSQESIILSIASSIMSTQRSSNSTSSMTDLTPSTLSAEQSFSSEPQTPKDDYCECTRGHVADGALIRRTSDCSMHLVPDHLTVPAPETLKPTKFDRRLLQFNDNTPATVVTTLSHRRAKSLASSLNGGAPAKTEIPTSSPTPSHSRKSSSGSRIPVPARNSSISTPEPTIQSPKKSTLPAPATASKSTSRRHRSATTTATGARPNHKSRASYSLFPGASTPVLPPMSPLPTLAALQS